ncbi:MAG: hypothetical protein JOZ69_07785 [Myxococcales bacterium]|nr:hypothetical protein [Myxococcales bacterium]
MTSPERRAPEISWSTIEDACDDAELYRLHSLTDEEREQELRAAGIDPNVGEQILREVLEKLGDGAAAPAAPVTPAATTERAPIRAGAEALERAVHDGAGPVRRSPVLARERAWWKSRSGGPWLAAAGLAIVVGLGVTSSVFRPTSRPGQDASALRAEAFGLCDAARWAECRAKLDEAKTLDPAGDGDPKVGAARKRIDEALRESQPK